jgi:hypothetical protein
MNEYGLDLKKWCATMMDRASTNKNAKSLIEAKTEVLPILILVFCISHAMASTLDVARSIQLLLAKFRSI